MARPRENETERFWRYAEKDSSSGCWLWKGSLTRDGYGIFHVRINENGRKYQRAHRWAYDNFVGLIPDGLTIDHLCRVRNCVNPDHLEVVTGKENTLRGEAVSSINSRKTHCINGHELIGENIYRGFLGKRICYVCIKIRKKEYRKRDSEKIVKVVPTHCRNGHLWIENTTFNHIGKRVCSQCSRDQKSAYKKRQREKT